MAKATTPKAAPKTAPAKAPGKGFEAKKLDLDAGDNPVQQPKPRKAVAPAPEDDVNTGLRVRANRMVFYGNKRRRQGDVFDLAHESHFSERSMEWVDRKTPVRTTKSEDALKEQQQEIRNAVLLNKGSDEVL